MEETREFRRLPAIRNASDGNSATRGEPCVSRTVARNQDFRSSESMNATFLQKSSLGESIVRGV